MNDHSFLPPSGASSWAKCNMWPSMNRRFPQTDSVEAIEGTAAHWVAWEILSNRPITAGAKAPNDTIVTEEMIESGELVADTIRLRLQIFGMQLHIEERIQITSIHPTCFGTPDCWAVSTDRKHIEIIDYKFGHRFVDEFWNEQGLCYLAGILDILSREWGMGISVFEPFIDVSFTVVQPRCFYRGAPVRTHTFNLSETRQYFNRLANAAEASTLPAPVATTNSHCIDCSGRHACSALQQAAYSDAEFSNARMPVELTPIAAALELRILQRANDRLEARIDGLKELTLSNMRAGHSNPYFRIEQGYGRSLWKIPNDQVIAIGQMWGIDLSKIEVVTPNQAKKSGIDEALVRQYTFTPSTAIKLVAEDPKDAPRVFAKLSE